MITAAVIIMMMTVVLTGQRAGLTVRVRVVHGTPRAKSIVAKDSDKREGATVTLLPKLVVPVEEEKIPTMIGVPTLTDGTKQEVHSMTVIGTESNQSHAVQSLGTRTLTGERPPIVHVAFVRTVTMMMKPLLKLKLCALLGIPHALKICLCC